MKTNTTAVVLIPPETVWPPIQDIRRRHDRQFRRWMPHVTLLYPFRPKEEFSALAERFAEACATFEPFEVTLAEVRSFDHGGERYTFWLAPAPADPIAKLQEALWQVAPDCDDVRLFEGGFKPHLSVGQALRRPGLGRLHRELQSVWRPLRFTADTVSLIWRNDPPDDVFRVGETVSLD